VATIHCHQNSYSYQEYSFDHDVPDFLVDLAHKAIDNGADVFIGHGVHTIRGAEIYKGKPIFYGLNSLFFIVGGAEAGTNAARRQQTGFYDSAVGVTEFKGGKPSVVRIYPITTIVDRVAAFGGSKIATGADAKRILARIQKESEPFGTDIKIENDVGVIRIAR